jgi:maleylacetoacetate isomerase
MTNPQSPVLFDSWQSSAAYRVRIALYLKAIEFRSITFDLFKLEHEAPQVRSRNPQGMLPILEIDGLTISQSLAIIEYLDETRGGVRLLPEDPPGKSRVRMMSYVIAMETHPITNMKIASDVAAFAGNESVKTDWLAKYVRRGLDAFELHLEGPDTGRFSHGDQPTMADCCLVPQVFNARKFGIDVGAWPRIEKVCRACEELDAFAAAHPDRVAR